MPKNYKCVKTVVTNPLLPTILRRYFPCAIVALIVIPFRLKFGGH